MVHIQPEGSGFRTMESKQQEGCWVTVSFSEILIRLGRTSQVLFFSLNTLMRM